MVALRRFGPVLLPLIGAALGFWALAGTWLTVSTRRLPILPALSLSTVVGNAIMPWAKALCFVAAAAGLAALTLRDKARLLLATGEIAVGMAMLVGALVSLLVTRPIAGIPVEVVNLHIAWAYPSVYCIASILVIIGGVLTLLTPFAPIRPSSSPDGSSGPTTPDSEDLRIWRAIDSGEDPTVGQENHAE